MEARGGPEEAGQPQGSLLQPLTCFPSQLSWEVFCYISQSVKVEKGGVKCPLKIHLWLPRPLPALSQPHALPHPVVELASSSVRESQGRDWAQME